MGWRDAPIVNEETVLAYQQAPPAPPSVAEDIHSGIPTALGRIPFVLAGAASDTFGLGMRAGGLIDRTARRLFGGDESGAETDEQIAARNPFAPVGSRALEGYYEEATGTPFYNAQTPEGQVVQNTVTGAGAGAITGAGGGGRTPIPRTVPSAVIGGAAGAGATLASQATEGTDWQIPAEIAGAVAAAAAANTGIAGLRRAVTPRNIPAENARMAQILRNEGVTGLTEGQITRLPQVQIRERQRMGDRATVLETRQLEQNTAAMLRRMGSTETRATGPVMRAELDRIGGTFDTLGRRNTLQLDQQFGPDLQASLGAYARRVGEPNRVPAVRGFAMEILNHARQGPIPGDVYQALSSRLKTEARAMRNDPHAQAALNDMAHDLDEAMERSIARTNPRDLGAFREVRRQYKNYLVVEDAVTRAGDKAALGLITPEAARGANKTTYGKRNMATDEGDFAELTRAGSALLTGLPKTGYAPAIKAPLSTVGAIQLIPTLLSRGVNELRMTAPVQRWLTNRMLPPPGRPATRTGAAGVPAVVNALAPDEGGVPSTQPPAYPQLDAVIRALIQ